MPRRFNLIVTILLVAALAFSAYILVLGLDAPLFERHAFRQSQTAISAYWIAQGGPVLAYETPVLGWPWSVPFEFPTYQLMVAGLAQLGLGIAAAGRLVSYAFFIGTLGPLWLFFRAYRFDVSAFLLTAVLFILSPLYVFWGRSVMIESTALFFSAAWVACLAGAFQLDRKAWFFGAALLAGTLAALTKSTTFLAFGLPAAAVFLHGGYAILKQKQLGRLWPALLAGVAVGAIPLLVGAAWVVYSDAVKMLNPIGASLTSSSLQGWNYGSLERRLSSAFWNDVFMMRSLPDLFGYGFPLALVLLGCALPDRRHMLIAAAAIGAFLAVPMVFTNLYFVHTYYWTAVGLFPMVAVGLGLHALAKAGRRDVAIGLLGLIAAAQLAYFVQTGLPDVGKAAATDRVFQVAQLTKANTASNEAVIVFGLDWSSELLYYSERKGLAFPVWEPAALLASVLASPAEFLGGHPLGAVVDCYPSAPDNSQQASQIKQALASSRVVAEYEGCRIFNPASPTSIQ